LNRIEKEIEFYKEISGKLISISVLIGAGTLAVWHKEGFSVWVAVGIIGFYFSIVAVGIALKRWRSKISQLEDE